MSRVLVLIAAIIFFRSFLLRRRRRFVTEPSPYMSALDGVVSPRTLSSILEETHNFRAQRGRAAS